MATSRVKPHSFPNREPDQYFRRFDLMEDDPGRLAREKDHFQLKYYHKHPI